VARDWLVMEIRLSSTRRKDERSSRAARAGGRRVEMFFGTDDFRPPFTF
jgi:hypothetical protein